MSQAVRRTASPGKEPRDWWRTTRSLSEIAEHCQQIVKEKQELEERLSELLHENTRLKGQCDEANAELATERSRRTTKEGSQAKVAAKERLLKDELVRTIQELTVQLKQERDRREKQVEELNRALSNCICAKRPEKHRVAIARAGADLDPWFGRDRR
jgi:molecular chaperone GrpE (heat shock protein)